MLGNARDRHMTDRPAPLFYSRRLAAMAIALSVAVGLSTTQRAAALPAGPEFGGPVRAEHSRDDGMSPRLAAVVDQMLLERAGTLTVDRLIEASGLPTDGPGALLTDHRGRLVVDVTLSESTRRALASLATVGAELIATDDGPVLATVAVPIDAVRALADLPTVSYVAEVVAPLRSGSSTVAGSRPAAGSPAPATPGNPACASRIVSEGDVQLRANELRATTSADGSGVVVGVVSDSYNRLGGAGADIADGELPGVGNPCGRNTPVTIQSEFPYSASDEGRAMLQIVHDLAPGADLVFASGALGELAMTDEIRQLGDAGVDIVTDDLAYLTEPMFQDGLIAQAIEENRTEHGVLHFAAAGNSNVVVDGKNVASYEAPAFRPTTCPSGVPTHQTRCHDVDGSSGVDAGAGLTIAPGGSVMLVLGWNEPLYGVTTDLDLYLVDTVTNSVVASSTQDSISSMRAGEHLSYQNTTGQTRTFDVVIGRYDGGSPAGTPRLRTVLVRASGLIDVEYDQSANGDIVGPTLFGHAAESSAMSVAAIRYDATSAPEPFSSRGPSKQCWEQRDGTTPQPAITPCASSTIDITATDGAANSFFGSTLFGGHRFFGTSAAAPHAAAVAALLADARPCADVDELASALTAGASPIGAFGVNAVGAGLVDAVESSNVLAVTAGCTPTIEPIDDLALTAGEQSAPITVSVADLDDPVDVLATVATSSNPSLLPDSAIEITSTGFSRSLTVTAPTDTSGSAEITVTVTDPSGRHDTTTFTVTIGTVVVEPAVFVSLEPTRFADSRDEATFDGRYRDTGPRPADSRWEIEIAGRGDVPHDATAVVANVTLVGGVGPGFATVFPCGELPTASSVNAGPGSVEANEVIAKLSSNGTLCVYTLAETHVIVDVVGYVADDSPYRPLAPARFADSRDEATFDGRYRDTGPRPADSRWEIEIAGRGDVPHDATAVVANITVTGGDAPGFATVHPCGQRPNASSLNYGPGITRPNEVVARLSPSGTLCIDTLTAVDVIVDVVGYLPDTGSVMTMTPRRYADSRTESTFDGAFRDTGTRRGGTTWTIDVTGRGAIPADATTVLANVTVIGEGDPGFATVHPCGELPNASSLNYDLGAVRANEVIARLDPNGALCVFTLTDAHVIVDVVGYA
jgi:Subtilase family